MTTPTNRIQCYLQLKPSWPDQLLLLRSGDLYETYDADAAAVARCLNDATSLRDGHPWWCCAAEDLEPCQKRLLKAGYRVAVGDVVDPEDGEVEVLESGDLPTDRGSGAERLVWPVRPTKGESPEGYLLDIWTCHNGELRVVRTESIDGRVCHFSAQAFTGGDEEEDHWAELGRTRRLAQALELALKHYRGTSRERRTAAPGDLTELYAWARTHGLAEAAPDAPESVETGQEKGEIVLGISREECKIDGGQTHTSQEQDMSGSTATLEDLTAAMQGADAGVPSLVLTEEDARQLAFELGWKMDAKDNAVATVVKHLNSITRETAVEDLERPTSPDSRAYLKQLVKTVQAGGQVIITEGGVVEEKSKRRVQAGVNAVAKKEKTPKAEKKSVKGRWAGIAACIRKHIGNGNRGEKLHKKVAADYPGVSARWLAKREQEILEKSQGK